MKIIDAHYEILHTDLNDPSALERLERIIRVCYKSEDKIVLGDSTKFIKHIVDRKHFSMLEHLYSTVKFVVDRGVSHEIVRHRLASFAQESTRYCNYASDKFNNELTFIKPPSFLVGELGYHIWVDSMQDAEDSYLNLIKLGIKPEIARSVLPNSLKTELVVTANIREWKHILELRSSYYAHPQMIEVMVPLQNDFHALAPYIF